MLEKILQQELEALRAGQSRVARNEAYASVTHGIIRPGYDYFTQFGRMGDR